MKKIKDLRILITGAGSPGISGTIYSLKNNFDRRNVFIVGTDKQDNVVGKYLCDKFYEIPPANNSEAYLSRLKQICKNEKIEVLIPQNTTELNILSINKDEFEKHGVKLLISNSDAINNSNDKLKLMQLCKEIGIPVGDFYLVNNMNELRKKAELIGWPEKKVVIKPPISNGLRGVRIIDEKYNSKEAFYNEKPNSLVTNLNHIFQILGNEFPDLILTEYLPGDEITVDVFRKKDKILVVPRLREIIRSGITFTGKVIKNEQIINYSITLSEKLNLEYCFGFQFKYDENGIPKILESNPRVQGTMVLSTFANANVIWLAVKSLLGEEIDIPEIKWGTRLLRYWGGIAELNGIKIGQI